MSWVNPESARRPWFIEGSGKPVPLHFLHLSLGTVEDVGKLVTDLTRESVAKTDSYICAHADPHKETLLILGKPGRWDKASRTLMKSTLETQFGQRSGELLTLSVCLSPDISVTPLRVTLGTHPLAEQAEALWLEYLAKPVQDQPTLFLPGPEPRARHQACFHRPADDWQDGVGEQTWDNAAFYIEDLRELLDWSKKLSVNKATQEKNAHEQKDPDQDLDWAAVN